MVKVMPQPDWRNVIDLSYIQDEEKRGQIAALMDWYAEYDPTYGEMISNLKTAYPDGKVHIVLHEEQQDLLASLAGLHAEHNHGTNASFFTFIQKSHLDSESDSQDKVPVISLDMLNGGDYIAANGHIFSFTVNEILRHELAHAEHYATRFEALGDQRRALKQELQGLVVQMAEEHPKLIETLGYNSGKELLETLAMDTSGHKQESKALRKAGADDILDKFRLHYEALSQLRLHFEADAITTVNRLRTVLGKGLRSHPRLIPENLETQRELAASTSPQVITDAPDVWEHELRGVLQEKAFHWAVVFGVEEIGIPAIHQAWGEAYNVPDYNLTVDERRVLLDLQQDPQYQSVIGSLKVHFSQSYQNDRIKPKELEKIEKQTGVDLPDEWKGRPQQWER